MPFLASIDDIFLKIISDPNALGAIGFILVTNIIVFFIATRFAASGNKNITEIYKADNKSSNDLATKLVGMASAFSDSAKQIVVVVENNTKALIDFKRSNEILDTSVNSLMTTVQDDLIKKLDELAVRVSKVETQGCEILNLVLSIKQLILKEPCDGTSDNTNANPAGSSSENTGDRTTTL